MRDEEATEEIGLEDVLNLSGKHLSELLGAHKNV